MALTPEQIDGLRARMEDIAQPIIDWLLADLAERVAEAGKMTSTAAYEAYRAKALGASERELKKFLKKQLGISNREVRRLLRAAARFSSEDDFDRVGVWATEAQRESLEQMTQAAIQLATKDFTNLTQTMGMVDCITGRPLPLQDAYRQAMDFAFEQIFTGAADYETAIRQATRKLADRGVVAIDYASGVSTELGAAVRRNMMGGMGLLVEQITQANHDALGCDGWEISAHAASAPDHEPYQGRQYSDAEYTRLNEEILKRRIGTLNCGHYPSPIILGVNSPQYTEAELEEFRRANAEGITYEGRHYTAYETTQRRNRFESAIRRQKRRVLVSEKNGDADQLLADRIKLTRLNQEYSKFCKAADLKTRPQRLQQDGFGRRQAAQAGAAAAHLANVKNSDTIKAVSGGRITNQYGKAANEHAERYYGLVRSMKTDVKRIAKNTGYPEEEIQRIKNFIFVEKHDLGDGKPRQFDPDFAMAQSWQRLILGKPEPHDLTLLRHEVMEQRLMKQGLSQSEAHIQASQSYNYPKESDEYYASLKERKNKRKSR